VCGGLRARPGRRRRRGGEIAPTQTASDRFVAETRRLLDAPGPTLAAVKAATTDGFVGEVKRRGDTRTVDVTERDRHLLPDELASRLLDATG